jgi:hypothetical protein
MNQLEAFVANLEKSLERRYQECNDHAATPSSILLAVLSAIAEAREHLNDVVADAPQVSKGEY